LLARSFRVIQVADALHLDAPVFDVLREAEFLRACADELAPGIFW